MTNYNVFKTDLFLESQVIFSNKSKVVRHTVNRDIIKMYTLCRVRTVVKEWVLPCKADNPTKGNMS